MSLVWSESQAANGWGKEERNQVMSLNSYTYTTLDVPAEQSQEPEQREGLDFDRLREQVDDLAEDPNDIPAYLWGELPRLIDMAERCEAAEYERASIFANYKEMSGRCSRAEAERDRLKAALYAPPGQQNYLSYTELRRRLVEAEQERTNAVCDQGRIKAELAIEQTRSAAQLGSEWTQAQMERAALKEERDRLNEQLAGWKKNAVQLGERLTAEETEHQAIIDKLADVRRSVFPKALTYLKHQTPEIQADR